MLRSYQPYYIGPQTAVSKGGLDLSTGIFKAPKNHNAIYFKSKSPVPYVVTVTARLSKHPGLVATSYAQLFLLKNGKLGWKKQNLLTNTTLQMNYLLVETNKVAELRMMVNLTQGETMELFVGHIPESLNMQYNNVQPIFLEDVRFCVFAP